MHRYLVLVVAAINVFFYRYIFIRYLPVILANSISGGTDYILAVNSITPLLISVPQSITQTNIKIAILKEFCPQPVISMKLIGPEIYHDILINDTGLISSINENYVHVIQYDIPSSLLLGEYKVKVSLLQCGTHNKFENSAGKKVCYVESEWNHIINIGSQSSNAKKTSWVLAPKCKTSESRSSECYESGDTAKQTDYIYMEIDRETNTALYNNLITIQEGVTISLPPSLSSSSDTSLIKSFEQLSNYELVCFVGDDDAQQYYRAFMSIYPLISNGQRPFKFKYLELKNVANIATDLSQTDTYKKCKIIFISYGVDRFDAGISAETFGAEVQTILDFIRKTHSDERYDRSAWFLSPRSSSSMPTSCISAEAQGRTPFRIHSAINELHNIFNEKQVNRIDQAEPQIHFMDNSNITESLSYISNEIDDSNNQHIIDLQISSVVAMRCMEKIAQTVKEWRSNRQYGTINGVTKDGKLIPNGELF